MDEHRMYEIISFEIVGDYTLAIDFNDGSRQVIDFSAVLHGPVYSPLRDVSVFNQVVLVEYAGCLEWPTGADFDPETLHDWPNVKDDIISRLQEYA